MDHRELTPQEIRRLARLRAGRMLHGVLNVWEPDETVAELGQENTDRISDEIQRIANRLMRE